MYPTPGYKVAAALAAVGWLERVSFCSQTGAASAVSLYVREGLTSVELRLLDALSHSCFAWAKISLSFQTLAAVLTASLGYDPH